MATFTDRHGREWRVGFTMADFARFRAAGIDLNAALKGGGALADLLFGDVERLGRLAWLVVERQAEAAGVTPEQFADGIDAAVLEGMGEAIAEGLVAFCPRSQIAAAILGRTKAALATMDEKVVAALSEPPRKPAGGSPASSGWTPTP